MILVTVGMHTDGFARLVEAMDKVATGTAEQVVMQIGSTAYEPQAANWFDFTTQQEMERLTREARIVVSHAGAGSILLALSYGKPLIVVPRLEQHGEHFDDHQLELAAKLAETGALLMVDDVAELPRIVDTAEGFQPHVGDQSSLMVSLRKEVLETAQVDD